MKRDLEATFPTDLNPNDVLLQDIQLLFQYTLSGKTHLLLFRATLTKIQSIKMNHNYDWAQIRYTNPYQGHLK